MLTALRRSQTPVEAAVVSYEHNGTHVGEVSLDLQVARSNSEFHGTIARASGNERLLSLITDLQDFFPKDYVWRAMTSADEVRALNLDEHDAIREALARRSASRARKEMRNHILHASRILLEYLDRLGFWQ